MSNWFDGLYLADFRDAGSGGEVVAIESGVVFYRPFGIEDQVHCNAISPEMMVFFRDTQQAEQALKEHMEERGKAPPPAKKPPKLRPV